MRGEVTQNMRTLSLSDMRNFSPGMRIWPSNTVGNSAMSCSVVHVTGACSAGAGWG